MYVYVFDVNNCDVPLPCHTQKCQVLWSLETLAIPTMLFFLYHDIVCTYICWLLYGKVYSHCICFLQSKIIQQATIQRENCYEEEVR